MDNGHKSWNSGLISNAIVIGAYIVTLSGVAFVTISNTNRNAAEIEKQERLHREDMVRMDKTIQDGFRELRKEIRDSK